MEMSLADIELLLDAEDILNREAHQEEVDEMRLARDCGEYDCGQDDDNDENCTDCHWAECPKKSQPSAVEVKMPVNQARRRRDRRKRANLKKGNPKPQMNGQKRTFVAPNYQAYLKYSRSRRPVLKAAGHNVSDCNAIIFEEWHNMDVDQKIPFYEKMINR